MADLVVDTSVWLASLLPTDSSNRRAQEFFFIPFKSGAHICHLPRIVLVEICCAFARQLQGPQAKRISAVLTVQQNFVDWEKQGWVRWYDLDGTRMERAIRVGADCHLRGADAIVAALSDELGFKVLTFDMEILERYLQATFP